MEKLSIIVPALNEEKRIGVFFENYISYFKNLKKQGILDFEIVLVLNNCEDNTKGVAESFNLDEMIILELLQEGKGIAITEGFKNALTRDNDFIGFVDADMATPPEAFFALVRGMRGYDGTIANRWDKRSIIKARQSLLRRILSRGFNLIVKSLFLFPYQDTQCGAKIFRRKMIEKVIPKIGSTRWAFDIDLLFYSKKAGAKIKSVPTIWEDKTDSRINLKKVPLTMFLSVIRLRLVHSPFNFIVQFYHYLPQRLKLV
ncbi:MAG: glycosyltransferase [archaeon]